MHKLVRQVRFSVNPFREAGAGYNSFAGKPAGEGVAFYFDLSLGLVGEIDGSTGFFINIIEIDRLVRLCVVPIFEERIRRSMAEREQLGSVEICEMLKSSCDVLSGRFGKGHLVEMTLKMDPFRKFAVDCEGWGMLYFSEKFEFAAMHKLWCEDFSEEKNFAVFGKCAHPSGHGHNYTIEVTVKAASSEDISVGKFEKVVDENLIELLDHKNLNADIGFFGKENPTVENIAIFAWESLKGVLKGVSLHSVTVWETDKTCCTYYG